MGGGNGSAVSLVGTLEPQVTLQGTLEAQGTLQGVLSDGYKTGHDAGYEEGRASGYTEGKEAEYNAFWDMVQDYGNRRNYECFCSGWNTEEVNNKYQIITVALYRTFVNAKKLKTVPVVESPNGSFDNCYQAFSECNDLEEIPFAIKVVSTNINALNNMCMNCYELIRLHLELDGTEYVFNYTFANCRSLTELIISGPITSSGFDVGDCPLNRESLESVIGALSGTAYGKSITVSKMAVNNAFETSTGAADGSTSPEWFALVETKPNWTIVLKGK